MEKSIVISRVLIYSDEESEDEAHLELHKHKTGYVWYVDMGFDGRTSAHIMVDGRADGKELREILKYYLKKRLSIFKPHKLRRKVSLYEKF